MRNTVYFQQANAVTSVLETIKQERAEMIQEVKNTEPKIMRAMQMTQEHFEHNREQRDDVEDASPSTQRANSTATDVVQLEILKLF